MARPIAAVTADSKELYESERLFRLLVEGVVDYAIFMLDPQGQVINWNAGAERIKGYRAGEIIGRHFSAFYTPEDRKAGKPQHSLATALREGRFEAEGWRVRKDGSHFLASVVIDAIYENGELIGFAKITRDITERRNAQLQLEKVQRQLAEAQKMDALGQLTGGVAHDFNNLLMIVSGHVQAFKNATEPKYKRAAHAIELAAQRGAALTSQLLTFARRQRVNPESFDIGERVQAVREVLRSGLGSGSSLVINVAPDAWPVKVDPNEFEIALVNLVINARDAMPDGGVVTVTADNTVRAGEDFVAVSVQDGGVGIPEDVKSRIFEPFFTTKPVGKGTGLGLSQVHGFVHQAHGALELESELGKGTTITMFLPRSRTQVRRFETSLDIVEGNGMVLLVEDNPDVASVSSELLKQLGYDVRWVPNAASALDEIAQSKVDIVFSDIVMPGTMDGLSLAHELKRKHPSLPVLLATGYSDAAQSGAGFPILRKPYQLHELSQALASVRSPVRAVVTS